MHMLEVYLIFTVFLIPTTVYGQIEGLCDETSCSGVECDERDDCDEVIIGGFPCGCCDVCLNYLEENEECPLKIATIPTAVCGPGLICKIPGTCQKKSTNCTEAQSEYEERYENGTIGTYEHKYECDEDGEFSAVQCMSGSMCYCVNKEGSRIFGEDLYENEDNMDCECARYAHETQNLVDKDATVLHCLPNGNFDTLQCVDNTTCFCLENGKVKKPFQSIQDLEDLPCYNSSKHSEIYFHECEALLNELEEEEEGYAAEGVTLLGVQKPNCSVDGLFDRVQYRDEWAYCSTPYGEQIGDFKVDRNSIAAQEMDCKCGRTLYWMEDSFSAKPECCKNGNFRVYQCRGPICFCVDEDGNQSGPDVVIAEGLEDLDDCSRGSVNNPLEDPCGSWGNLEK